MAAQTAGECRELAAQARQRSRDSFERCDTDGFLSQWASNLTAQEYERRAKILDAGGVAEFSGLYEGDRRVKARVIETQFGWCWLLHEDEAELRERRGKPFLPTGARSRVLKQLGLREAPELAPADARLTGTGTGLSGQAWVTTVRTGDQWGQDAQLVAAAA